MAWLGTPGDARIGFAVACYEFPESNRRGVHDWDSNWLVIDGRVECSHGEWSFREPCLTTWELAALLSWLESPPLGEPSSIDFTEPLLGFRFDGHWSSDRPIEVRLRAEALVGAGLDDETAWHVGLSLPLKVSQASVRDFALRLRFHIERFPER
ncbi:MAG: hypothetical protein KIS87_14585 [Phycisphaeraceae bacterium]|nr:hypothetical protein [Phycisphaeraceae bacterium]